ncbi:hypothetical protein ACIQWA_13360 [Kitasatospora sp. NPDC098652]|uniref:hypothetical protein n=1 Tax=Kitasatospora sp. NPDC098652 TaxID=3364095 RepID=UPI0037F47D5F
MKHIRTLTVGATTLVVLGGGLLGWHVYLDRTEYRPPAVSLSHGECEGTLDDPGFAALLGATPRVFVDTDFRTGTTDLKPRLRCSVQGQGERRVLAYAFNTDEATVTAPGEATFTCTLNGKAELYWAALRPDRQFPQADLPAPDRRDALLTGFARKAAGKLGCANGAESFTIT